MTSNRRFAVIALGLVFLLSGCIGPFAGDGGGLDEDALDAEADYEWDADTDAHVRVESGSFYAVYDLEGETTYELSSSSFTSDSPLDIEAVRYRYPNGTELPGSDLEIEQDSSSTVVEVPDGNGTLAFSGPASSKQVEIPGLVEGSYTVELPPDFRVGNFFLSDVDPTHSSAAIAGDRQVLTWDDNGADIYLKYYLWRDHYLFWGTGLGLGALAIGGVLYYRRQIKRLTQRRQELGFDIYEDDD